MKNLFLLFLICASNNLNAQKIQPTDATIQHDGKSRPCLFAEVDPESKTLKDEWNDFLKDNYDLKLKGIGFLSNKDLMSRKETVVEAISPNTLNFYTEIVESESGSEMRVFVSFGYEIYVDKASLPNEYKAVREMMTTFLNTYVPNYYIEIIAGTEDVLNDLTKDQKKLKKSISKDSEKAAKLSEKIESLKEDVEENKSELEEVETKLSKRQEKLTIYKTKLNSVQ